MKRNGHRLITDAALCIASSSKLKYGYRPAIKVNVRNKRKLTQRLTFIRSKNLKRYQDGSDHGRWKRLTSQKDPELLEG